MKKLRKNLIYVLILLILILLYFIIDKYIFNPTKKGISIVDIKHTVYYSILPLFSFILLTKVAERFEK